MPRHTRPALAQPLHGVDRHSRRQPGNVEGARGGALDLLLHQGIGGRADAHRPGRRVLLEAQGHLRRLAHGRIGPLGEHPEGPRHHRPRVHPQLHGHRARVSGGVLGQGGLAALPEVARRQHGPPRVVLLRRWGAKQGRKPLPRAEREGAVVVLDHLLHQRQPGLEQAIQALGAEACRQAGHLGERAAQHRQLFVFPIVDLHRGTSQGSERWGKRR